MAVLPLTYWIEYTTRLRQTYEKAEDLIRQYIAKYRIPQTYQEFQTFIDYAYAVSTKYGEAAAEVAGVMYEQEARASKVSVPDAVPASTPEISEVAKAVRGTAKTGNADIIASAIGRLVKRTAVDTTMQNAIRDGAEWAWIPQGDTCSFCIMLASNGWQKASKAALKGGHAEHVHANCDCTYAVRFNGQPSYEGYDPDKYSEMYENAEGDNWKEKLNSMRRDEYAKNADKLNARKRELYAEKNQQEYLGIPKSWQGNMSFSPDEVLRGANPYYRRNLPDYLTGTKDDYTNNCTNSVVAYSMRQKGYNVTAKSIGECGTLRNGDKLFSAWKGRKPIKTSGSGLEDILKYMQDCEDGTLLAITVDMPKTVFNPLPGHAFVAEKSAGEVVFLDPQTASHYNNPKDLFDTVQKDCTKFMRIDDLEISDRGVSACKEAIK